MIIPKNVLIRNNVKKPLAEHANISIKKFSLSEVNSKDMYKKRINSNLRKRLNSLLSCNTIKDDEVADFLSLLDERLRMEGSDLEEAVNNSKLLDTKYGSYSKRYNTKEPVLCEDADLGFIEFYIDFHSSEKFKRENGITV